MDMNDPTTTTTEEASSKAIPQGARVSLRSKSKRGDEWLLRQKVSYNLVVENTGPVPFVIATGGDNRRSRTLRLKVRVQFKALDNEGREQGEWEEVRDPHPDSYKDCMGGRCGEHTIESGGSESITLDVSILS